MDEGARAFTALCLLVLIFLLIPAKYDPTIRMKEWLEDWKVKKKGPYK